MWSLCFAVVVAQCPEGAIRGIERLEGHLRGIGRVVKGALWALPVF